MRLLIVMCGGEMIVVAWLVHIELIVVRRGGRLHLLLLVGIDDLVGDVLVGGAHVVVVVAIEFVVARGHADLVAVVMIVIGRERLATSAARAVRFRCAATSATAAAHDVLGEAEQNRRRICGERVVLGAQ